MRKPKLKQFKTLKEFERQIPERLAIDGTIPLKHEEIRYYYHNLLGLDIPPSTRRSFNGYPIREIVVQ